MSNNRVDVHVGARTSDLQRGMDNAQDIVENTSENIERAGRNTNFEIDVSGVERTFDNLSANISSQVMELGKRIAAGFASALAVDGLIDLTQNAINTASEVQKMSELVGESVEDFQYFAKGAETAGLSLEQFGMMGKDALDRLGEARRGEGEMMDFFTQIAPKIGVTIDQFKNLSGPEVIQAYYNGLDKANLSHAEIITYMEQIVNDGSMLIPLLKDGGAGFKKWGDEAQKAGAIMSKDMVDNLGAVKENLNKLKLQFQGFQAVLINAITPAVSLVAKHFDTIKSVVVALGAAVATKLVVQMSILSVEFIKGVVEGVRYQLTLAAMAGQTITLTTATNALRIAMVGLVTGPAGLAMLAAQAVAAGVAFLYMRQSSDEVEPSLNTQGKTVAELRIEYEKLDQAQQRIASRQATTDLKKATEAFGKQKIALLGLIRAVYTHGDASEADKQKAKDLYQEYLSGKITTDQLATAINDLKTVSDKSKKSIDDKASALAKESKNISAAETVLKTYNSTTKQSTEDNKENTKSIDDKAEALKKLTAKQLEYVEASKSDDVKEKYTQNLVSNGFSRERAEFYADKKEETGTPYNVVMPKVLQAAVDAEWFRTEAVKAREASEKKSEEAEQRKTKEMERQAAIAANTDQTTRNMLKVYQAFMNTGVLTDKQARYLTAEVGRENDFKNSGLYGSHTDNNNGQKNIGMISWQKDRAVNLEKYLSAQGVMESSGNIKQTQEALDAQARFLVNEIFNNKSYAKSKNVLSKNADYSELSKTIGKNTIGWDYDGKKINAQTHHQKRDGYYNKLNSVLGDDPSKVTAVTSSFTKLELAQTQKAEEAEKQRLALKYKYANEQEKVAIDLKNALNDIEKSTLSGDDKINAIVQAEKEAAEKTKAIRITLLEADQALQQEELQGKLILAERIYELEMVQLQALLDAGKISNVEKVKREKQLQDQLTAIKRIGLEERLDMENELGTLTGKPTGANSTVSEIGALDHQNSVSSAQFPGLIDSAQMKDFETRFGDLTSRMSGLWDKGIQSMMDGTLTWKNATNAVFTELAGAFIQSMITTPLKKYAASLATRLAMKLGFIKTETAAEVMGQTAQTGAVVAGEGVKTAATATGVLARLGLKLMEVLKSIMMSAWEAMAGAWAALSSIPIVGPALGVAAGVAAFAGVSALVGKVASARGGYDIPAGVNPMTQLHEEEMVLPKQHANTIRALGKSVMADGGLATPQSSSQQVSNHFTVQAFDSRDVKRFFEKHGRELANGLKGHRRNFGT